MPSSSNSPSAAAAAEKKSKHFKRFSLNENSIDADSSTNNDHISITFPNYFDNLKKFTDKSSWQKAIHNDCNQSVPLASSSSSSSSFPVWQKQPETSKPSTSMEWSTFYRPPRSNSFYDDNIWASNILEGENFFYPTSGSTSNVNNIQFAPSNAVPEVKTRTKKKSHNKSYVNSSILDSDDDFSTIKKRLSLSSLRNSLCKQKALENLNNENVATNFDEDVFQVLMIYCLYYFVLFYFQNKLFMRVFNVISICFSFNIGTVQFKL
jgi:hypothetical protein